MQSVLITNRTSISANVGGSLSSSSVEMPGMIFKGESKMVSVGCGEAQRCIFAASSSVDVSGDGAGRFATGVGVGWERWSIG